MQGTFPTSVVFGNRLVDAFCREFAQVAIDKAVAAGVVVEWPWQGTRPWVVLPLSVAVDAYGKMRLILDARYINIFLKYFPFAYARLCSLPGFTKPGYYIICDDLKAIYHHLRIDPRFWGLLDCELDGKIYTFTCLPFGLSQAPWVFTKVQYYSMLGFHSQRYSTIVCSDFKRAAAQVAKDCHQRNTGTDRHAR